MQRIVVTGGKQRSKIWQLFADKPYKIVYCEDPFGNIVEIYSHSVEHVGAIRDDRKSRELKVKPTTTDATVTYRLSGSAEGQLSTSEIDAD